MKQWLLLLSLGVAAGIFYSVVQNRRKTQGTEQAAC